MSQLEPKSPKALASQKGGLKKWIQVKYFLVGQIVVLFAYAIGVLIVIRNQKGVIEKLKTQVDSQLGIVTSMQRFMSIFKLDEVERFVKLSREKFILEKEQELYKKMKEYESKFLESKENFAREIVELLFLTVKLSLFYGDSSDFEKLYEKMKSGYAKNASLELLNKVKEELKALEKKEQEFNRKCLESWQSLMKKEWEKIPHPILGVDDEI